MSEPALDRIAAAFASGMSEATDHSVEPGIYEPLTDSELDRFAFPLHVASCELSGGVDETLVLLSNIPTELLSAGIVGGITSMISECSLDVTVGEPSTMEIADREAAANDLMALWNEMTISFNTPAGDALLIVGQNLRGALAGEQEDEEASSVNIPEPEAVDSTAGEDDSPAHDVEASDEETDREAVAGPASIFGRHGRDEPLAELDGAGPPGAQAHVWSKLLSGVDVTVSAELGNTSMSLGDATGLTAESIVTLDQMTDDPMVVYVNGFPFATARLVVVDDCYGIEIIEVISKDLQAAAETWLAA